MLSGLFPMLVTPFDEAGELVLDDLKNLVESVLGEGADGIAALGLGAEVGYLRDVERIAVTEAVTEFVNGRAPVIVGATADDTVRACAFAESAALSGAEAVMVAPPSAVALDRAAVRSHYLAVADAITPLPLMVQDAPAFIGVALDAAFVVDLQRSRPNICFAKTEAVPTGPAISAILERAAGRVAVFGGHAGLHAIEALDAGAVGMIPGCEVVRPLAELMRAHRSGDQHRAVDVHRRLLPLLAFMFESLDQYLACTKHLLHHRGLLSTPRTRTAYRLNASMQRELARLAAEAERP